MLTRVASLFFPFTSEITVRQIFMIFGTIFVSYGNLALNWFSANLVDE